MLTAEVREAAAKIAATWPELEFDPAVFEWAPPPDVIATLELLIDLAQCELQPNRSQPASRALYCLLAALRSPAPAISGGYDHTAWWLGEAREAIAAGEYEAEVYPRWAAACAQLRYDRNTIGRGIHKPLVPRDR